MHYLCSDNNGADQLCDYRTTDLRLCFCICKNRFSRDASHILLSSVILLVIHIYCFVYSFVGKIALKMLDIENRCKIILKSIKSIKIKFMMFDFFLNVHS